MLYSIIIPVYNRPEEINELLKSLTHQTFKSFEVLIVEDGSESSCKNIVELYTSLLDIRYYYKPNSGQGFSRNYGFDRAKGDYFIVFDSDCIVPSHYLQAVSNYLSLQKIDCWGGPDRAHSSFTPLQRAIDFSMTSFLSTGGIRGKSKRLSAFHPRSFNMGISREVYRKTGGYAISQMGEDIEFSIRIIKSGFSIALIEDAYVYHKRRTNLKQFFKQLHFFGRARFNISRFHPNELKFVHFLPVLFLFGILLNPLIAIVSLFCSLILTALYILFFMMIFISSLLKTKSLKIALLSILTVFIQLTAYAIGFISESRLEHSNDFTIF